MIEQHELYLAERARPHAIEWGSRREAKRAKPTSRSDCGRDWNNAAPIIARYRRSARFRNYRESHRRHLAQLTAMQRVIDGDIDPHRHPSAITRSARRYRFLAAGMVLRVDECGLPSHRRFATFPRPGRSSSRRPLHGTGDGFVTRLHHFRTVGSAACAVRTVRRRTA